MVPNIINCRYVRNLRFTYISHRTTKNLQIIATYAANPNTVNIALVAVGVVGAIVLSKMLMRSNCFLASSTNLATCFMSSGGNEPWRVIVTLSGNAHLQYQSCSKHLDH